MVDYAKLSTKATARAAAVEDHIADVLVDFNTKIERRLQADINDPVVKAIGELLSNKTDKAAKTLGLTTKDDEAVSPGKRQTGWVDVIDEHRNLAGRVHTTKEPTKIAQLLADGYKPVSENGDVVAYAKQLSVSSTPMPHDDDPITIFLEDGTTIDKILPYKEARALNGYTQVNPSDPSKGFKPLKVAGTTPVKTTRSWGRGRPQSK